ncbi:MAG: phosphatase PAP2 family protein [bacterium]|nr:phosphatase PAP2 family protein [bacterium]
MFSSLEKSFNCIVGNKLYIVVFAYIYFLIPYMLINHFHLFEPRVLPVFDFETKIPFIPGTVWVYLSDYILPISLVLLAKEKEQVKKLLITFMILMGIHFVIFLFFPTIFPREMEAAAMEGVSGQVLKILHRIDPPGNCFPSIHVSLCFFAVFSVFHINRKFFFPFFVWACCVSLSTLTIKQHYAVDIAAGFILAFIVDVCAWKFGARLKMKE